MDLGEGRSFHAYFKWYGNTMNRGLRTCAQPLRVSFCESVVEKTFISFAAWMSPLGFGDGNAAVRRPSSAALVRAGFGEGFAE